MEAARNESLENEDAFCTICGRSVIPAMGFVLLCPFLHLFHGECLEDRMNQGCPECRNDTASELGLFLYMNHTMSLTVGVAGVDAVDRVFGIFWDGYCQMR